MTFRFLINPATGEPHIYDHGVTEREVAQVLENDTTETRVGEEGALVALGYTLAGRFLRVVYRHEPQRGTIFVITSFTPGPRVRSAYRRRLRKKR